MSKVVVPPNTSPRQFATRPRLGHSFGLSLAQVRCIQGSFAVLNDPEGSDFLLALLMHDPEFHGRLSSSEAAVTATRGFWAQLVAVIGRLHAPVDDDDLELLVDHAARTLHKVAHVTVDDMMVIADLMHARAREAVGPLSGKYEATFAVAWEALLRPVFMFLSGNAPAVDLTRGPLAATVAPLTILKLTQSSLGGVARHLAVVNVVDAIPNTAEHKDARAAISKLEPDAIAQLVAAAASGASDTVQMHQALFRIGVEHRSIGVHRHYSVLYAAIMSAIHRALRVDYFFVTAAMSRAWRRFLRTFNDRIALRLGGYALAETLPPPATANASNAASQGAAAATAASPPPASTSFAQGPASRVPEPPATARTGAEPSPINRRALQRDAAASTPHSHQAPVSPPPPPARKSAEDELAELFRKHSDDDGTISRGAVVNLYLARTTGLDIDLKECVSAIERQTSKERLTQSQFVSVMLRVTRQ